MAIRLNIELILTGIQVDTIKEANLNIPEICCRAVRQSIEDYHDMLLATSVHEEKPRQVVKHAAQVLCQ